MQRSFASLRMTVGRVENSQLYIAAGMSDLRLKLARIWARSLRCADARTG